MRVRFAGYGKIALLVLATSFIVAFLLSSALQKTISRPITSLAETARIISEKNDYSVRAKKESEDEIGLLTDAFNLMLTEIQEQQSRLRKALEDTRSSEQEVKELNIDLERRVSVRTAELEEAVSQMEAFSYSVSHDLRAPLRAMQGYSEAVLEDCGAQLDDTAKDYLGRIKTSAIRMDRLIQDILSYSRVARSDLSIENVNLERLIETIIEQTPAFQEPHAKVELQKPLHSVCAHEPVLNQCMANLLGNAVKFVAPGVTPHLKIWSEVVGPQVRISVQDNGIGIKPDYIVRIFGMFERIHNYQQYEGTGIGLAIVKKAVERMGGSVGVESQPGQGSRFWILLPAGTDSLG
jgi:signal transduction histidine kinase